MDRELRRLLIVAVALLVLLFTGRAVISAFWDDTEAVRQAASIRRQLRSGGEANSRPSTAAVSAASALRNELVESLQAYAPVIAYTRPAEFDVPSGVSPDLRYIEVLREEQKLLVRGAAFVGRSVPSNLGMPDLNPSGLEDVLRTLQSLHIVHLVVSAALEAGVDAVDEIRIPTASRRERKVSGFLRTHEVEFELRGSPQAVREMLAGITGGTPYLTLDTLRVEALDDEGGKVRARFSAAAVTLDLEQSVLDGGQG
jgi:hypothetical protein